jgi:hypothetical protein
VAWESNWLTWCTVDPWFNFRATKYLVEHGFYSFWDWFDDRTLASPRRWLQCHARHDRDLRLANTRAQEHGIPLDESPAAPSTPD